MTKSETVLVFFVKRKKKRASFSPNDLSPLSHTSFSHHRPNKRPKISSLKYTHLTYSRRWYQKRIENSSPPNVLENTFLGKATLENAAGVSPILATRDFIPSPPTIHGEKACSYYLMAERCLRRWILRRCSGRDKIERRECGEKCAFRKFRDAGRVWRYESKK